MCGTAPPIDRAADAVAQCLGPLIRHYGETRSPQIAQTVARQIDIMCDRHAVEGDLAQRSAYLRLRAHWRLLAMAPVPPKARM